MAIQERAQPLSIGERIKFSRKSSGLSQVDLAKRIGVSQPAVANWESGLHDPRRVVLAKLADALGAPLEWLAAGARSSIEHDTHAAAAYLRRLVHHVPVLGFEHAALFAQDADADPHSMAQDYIPVTTNLSKLFAVLVMDSAVDRAFPRNTIVVIDYGDRQPADGAYCLLADDGTSFIRRWNEKSQQFERHSTADDDVGAVPAAQSRLVGCARVSIRFH